MFNDAPPSREDVTTSSTWLDSVEVKTFTSSGMIAPASVPQLMMEASFHQSVESLFNSGMIKYDITKVTITDTMEVSHTSEVSGTSKFISVALPYLPFANASFKK